ncbi:hypothetical protein CVT24_004444 [Panaeolus cyanescens]|uniref:Uncharacterized protein n=1 Tax=Panaeolus cyanescens TaxID=181874 RepID=A0A409YBK3_9AGAR|nr:hypothetical protein CVT24_004444 [Panaeolus cyanescens]
MLSKSSLYNSLIIALAALLASSAPLYESSNLSNVILETIKSRTQDQDHNHLLYTRGPGDPPERVRIITTHHSKSGKKRVEQTSIHYDDGYSGTINIDQGRGSSSRQASGSSSRSRPVGEPPRRAATISGDGSGLRSHLHNDLPPSFQPTPGRPPSFRHRPEPVPARSPMDGARHGSGPIGDDRFSGPRRAATMDASSSSRSAHRDRDRERERSRRPPPANPPPNRHSQPRPIPEPIYEEPGSGSGGNSPTDSEQWDHMPEAPMPPPAAW